MAVKVMLASAGDHASELESFRQEVQVLSGLAHERIICLLGACLAPPHICIVEELANAGSLFNLLHGARPGHSPHHGMPYAQVKHAVSLTTYLPAMPRHLMQLPARRLAMSYATPWCALCARPTCGIWQQHAWHLHVSAMQSATAIPADWTVTPELLHWPSCSFSKWPWMWRMH